MKNKYEYQYSKTKFTLVIFCLFIISLTCCRNDSISNTHKAAEQGDVKAQIELADRLLLNVPPKR